MGSLITAMSLGTMAITLLVVGIAMERNGRYFNTHKQRGKAQIVGYGRTEGSNWYTLLVKVLSLKDESIYSCAGGRIHKADFPVGMVVDVWYAPKREMGVKTVEVQLMNRKPSNREKLGRGIALLAAILLVGASILAVIGLKSII